MSAGKFTLEVGAWIVVDWARRPLGKVVGGVARGGSVTRCIFLNGRGDNLLAGRNRETEFCGQRELLSMAKPRKPSPLLAADLRRRFGLIPNLSAEASDFFND
jgi:hypothetical protein